MRKDLITPVTVPAPPLKSYGPPPISVEERIARFAPIQFWFFFFGFFFEIFI